MTTSTITAKGQITLPKTVRDALEVTAGDRVRCVIYGNRNVRIFPIRSVSRLYGFCRYDGPPVSIDDMNRAIEEGAIEK